MTRKIGRLLIIVLGGALGVVLAASVNEILKNSGGNTADGFAGIFVPWAIPMIYVGAAVLFGIIFFVLSPRIIDLIVYCVRFIEEKLSEFTLQDIFLGVVGLILGLIIAFLISTFSSDISIPWLVVCIKMVLYIVFGYLGWSLVMKRRSEINLPFLFKRGGKSGAKMQNARPKVLDTSSIIDGRIFDICKTGIVEGEIVVPGFVLGELQRIADSADAIKRSRGRRGLDLLNGITESSDLEVKIDSREFDGVEAVDAKLICLAETINGVVVTTDYNLNKVATVQRVPVLNINDLANAIKQIVVPGEERNVIIIKEGKEHNQGVAYLDDGTMIVVENGKRFLGESVTVVVTSVLQTSAGRMIFAKIK